MFLSQHVEHFVANLPALSLLILQGRFFFFVVSRCMMHLFLDRSVSGNILSSVIKLYNITH